MKKQLQFCFSKVFLISTLLSAAYFTSFAQTPITGMVKDSKKEPIPGVSVLIKGANTGTITDINGSFRISAPNKTSVLVFSSIGFDSKEITVGDKTKLEIELNEDTKSLQEVVVTALGIKKDVRRVGVSIQTVDGASTIKAREPNAIGALVGKVAGLTIGQQPELLRKPNIQLRGNSDVLFVIDGVPVNSDTWNVNPDDIENYSVLKGASASALYGFRGKNGAILITTKKGSKDKRGVSVDFNSSTMADRGFYAIPKVQDIFGPGDHGQYSFSS